MLRHSLYLHNEVSSKIYVIVTSHIQDKFIKIFGAIAHILLGNQPLKYGTQIRSFGHCVGIHHQSLMSVTCHISCRIQTVDLTKAFIVAYEVWQ
jgi:hypothetical protein